MANKKHLRKFGVNESLTARVADVGIIILHSSTGWEIVGCVFFKGVSSIQTVINAHVSSQIHPEAVICLVALLLVYTGTK